MRSSDWVKGARSCEFTIPLQPVPCPRPRVSRRGFTYYPPNYSKWKEEAARYVPETYPVFDGPVRLDIEFVLPPFKTVTRDVPRGDVDNYIKSVMDLLTSTGRVWADDIQVNVLYATKRFAKDGEEAKATIHVRESVPL